MILTHVEKGDAPRAQEMLVRSADHVIDPADQARDIDEWDALRGVDQDAGTDPFGGVADGPQVGGPTGLHLNEAGCNQAGVGRHLICQSFERYFVDSAAPAACDEQGKER